MIGFIQQMHILWSIWYNGLINKTREAVVILRYARVNGFPHGDEEYNRILSEAGVNAVCMYEE